MSSDDLLSHSASWYRLRSATQHHANGDLLQEVDVVHEYTKNTVTEAALNEARRKTRRPTARYSVKQQRRLVLHSRALLTSLRVSRFLGPTNLSTLNVKRLDEVTVYIHVVFLKVGEIDTIKERFSADVFVQARWREPLLDGHTQPPEEIRWPEYWNPQLYVDNVASDPKETVWRTVLIKDKTEAFVFERRRISGTFVESHDLTQFPFDTQELSLTLVSERSQRELRLVPDSFELSTVNVQSFVDEQVWRLYDSVETTTDTVTRLYQRDNSAHPTFTVSCRASRRYWFYFWNIMFVMFFITSCSFLTFAIVIEKTENRIQMTFTMLLTTVTFKFAASSSLPKISYLTYLDKYILSSFLMMCVICVWHAVQSAVKINVVDKIVCGSLLFIFLTGNLIFLLFIYIVAIRKRKTFRKKEVTRDS